MWHHEVCGERALILQTDVSHFLLGYSGADIAVDQPFALVTFSYPRILRHLAWLFSSCFSLPRLIRKQLQVYTTLL